MRRVVIAAADASRDLIQRGGNRFDAVFVTLTYRAESYWTTRDVAEYVQRVRMWLKRRNVRAFYQWVIELTRKGKPHYHVLFWVPKGVRLPKPDSSGMWEKGMSRIEKAYRPVGYMVMYATKGEGGDAIPKGARLFGVGAQDAGVKLGRHRHGLPMWLYDISEGRCRRVARVGWIDETTGEIHDSPFSFTVEKDAWGFIVVTIALKEHITC